MTARRFPQLLAMSMDECQKFIAGQRDICISIQSSRIDHLAKLSGNFRAVLRLQFDDIPWTDEPAIPKECVQITPEMADTVIRFVAANLDAHRLVIHCEAGVSRSVSMACAISKCWTGKEWKPTWCRTWQRWRDTLGRANRVAPNPNVYNAVVDAYIRRFPINRTVRTNVLEHSV